MPTEQHREPGVQPALESRFERILEDYGRLVRSAVRKVCPRGLGVQPEDIEQEVRLRLWRALQNETEIRHLPSYLYRVVATAMLEVLDRAGLRRERPQEWTSGPDPELGGQEPVHSRAPVPADRLAEERQVIDRVLEILAELPENRGQAVRLRLQGFTVPEVAGLTGWSQDKARNLAHRGMRDLRERLKAEGIEYEVD